MSNRPIRPFPTLYQVSAYEQMTGVLNGTKGRKGSEPSAENPLSRADAIDNPNPANTTAERCTGTMHTWRPPPRFARGPLSVNLQIRYLRARVPRDQLSPDSHHRLRVIRDRVYLPDGQRHTYGQPAFGSYSRRGRTRLEGARRGDRAQPCTTERHTRQRRVRRAASSARTRAAYCGGRAGGLLNRRGFGTGVLPHGDSHGVIAEPDREGRGGGGSPRLSRTKAEMRFQIFFIFRRRAKENVYHSTKPELGSTLADYFFLILRNGFSNDGVNDNLEEKE